MDAVTDTKVEDGFEWCIVEVFGHRSHVGRAKEEERFGAKMLRIDELKIDSAGIDVWETLYYGGSSLFSYRPVTEEVARKVAKRFYPSAPQITSRTADDEEDDDRPW